MQSKEGQMGTQAALPSVRPFVTLASVRVPVWLVRVFILTPSLLLFAAMVWLVPYYEARLNHSGIGDVPGATKLLLALAFSCSSFLNQLFVVAVSFVYC